MRSAVLTIPMQGERPPLTTNRMPRNHGYRARLVREIQEYVGWRGKSAAQAFGWDLPISRPIVVRLIWTVPDNRVRDSSGPDPTLKAAQDGLVKAGILLDDRHEIVWRSYCVIEKGDKYAMRLEILETGP